MQARPADHPFAKLAGRELGSRRVAWDERDAILYALAVGAPADDLTLVYERDLVVLPTYALVLGRWAVDAAGQLGAYDPGQALHVAQRLLFRERLPAAGMSDAVARIADVWDKGSAAIIDIAVVCSAFDAIYSVFVPGAGGWGGRRGATAPPVAPSSPPSVTGTVATPANLAALYRLTGDPHPLHVDGAFAVDRGYRRPVLHGLCTLGIATLKAALLLGTPPASLKTLSAWFVGPVYPGATLSVPVWDERDGIVAFGAETDGCEVLRGHLSFGDGTDPEQHSEAEY